MKNNQGQILLITIMLLATTLTVVLAISFRTTTETKTTKLQEDSQKALAAAEAGVEAALKQGNIADISSLNLGTGITGNATVSNITANEFTTRNLTKDEQYTFYLGTPAGDPPDFSILTPAYTNTRIRVCFNSAALEFSLINKNGSITRYAVNPVGTTIISNASSASIPGANDCPAGEIFSSTYAVDGITSNPSTGSILLIARVISTNASVATKIGFKAPVGENNLPIQGKTITSTASTATGATKKVQLFQSYPQIPSEFFVTTF